MDNPFEDNPFEDNPFECFTRSVDIGSKLSDAERNLTNFLQSTINNITDPSDDIVILTNYKKGTLLFERILGVLDTSLNTALGQILSNVSMTSVEYTPHGGFILRPTKSRYKVRDVFHGYLGILLSASDIKSKKDEFLRYFPLTNSNLILFLDSIKSGRELNAILDFLSMLDESIFDNIVSIIVGFAKVGSIKRIARRWGFDEDIFKVHKVIDGPNCEYLQILQALTGASHEPWERMQIQCTDMGLNECKEYVLNVIKRAYPGSDVIVDNIGLDNSDGTVKYDFKVEINDPSETLIKEFRTCLRCNVFNMIVRKAELFIEEIHSRELDCFANLTCKNCPLKVLPESHDQGLLFYCDNYLLLTDDRRVIREDMCIRECVRYNFTKLIQYRLSSLSKLTGD